MGSLSRGTKADQFSYVPAGTVLPFAGAVAPTGWAICDGSIVSRTEYAELYLAIGDAWGNGDGSTTFNLPDMRGQFLRGKDHGRHLIDGQGNPDGDLDVGTQTSDAIRNMTGTTYTYSGGTTTRPDSGVFDHTNTGNAIIEYSPNRNFSVNTANFDASRQVPTALDNRPKNVTVNYIIKL